MSHLKRLLDQTRAAAERKHCGPDDEDRARIAALEAELNAPIEKAARDGAARSHGRLISPVLQTFQSHVAEALTRLGERATDHAVLKWLLDHDHATKRTTVYHVRRARKSLLARAEALNRN